ncbi:hypothetical protein [Nostoc sp. 106C]|uniref:hypothetical protein n=1 Tax=Nostoc sp. 106C TaxID=1932667 RepID=UPI000A397938|nr:hypothetical protein [Nostoc sp. 106C]OUL24572.1 hypothetical protein BV378_19555 [Nostoc sp. RF31YmG]OUL26623.1 hypothetical protein BV375_21115 [Nostoc sp. 106C]
MKSAPLALAVIIGALTISQSAYANQKNSPTATSQGNQAAVLVTKPVTLTSKWSYSINRNNTFKTTTNSIALEQERGCKNLNPFEILKNPNILFQQCQQPTHQQTAQLAEPIEYLKVPRLDSGIKVTVSKF